jgi:hypothetical protein
VVSRLSVDGKPAESNGEAEELKVAGAESAAESATEAEQEKSDPSTEFNLGTMKGNEKFAKGSSGNGEIVDCGLGKPKAYFRAHPTCWFITNCLHIAGEGVGKDQGQYLIDSEKVAELLAGEEHSDVAVLPFRLTLVYDTDQGHMIFPLRIAVEGFENQLHSAHKSMALAVEKAEKHFVKACYDGKRYQVKSWQGAKEPKLPDWTTRTIHQWCKMAFRGRIIKSTEDPILLRALGMAL